MVLARKLAAALADNGYQNCRLLPTGEVIGTHPMIYTTGLFVGLDMSGYRYRYCYEHRADAELAAATWDGAGDPPGPWVVEKGRGAGDRYGPGAT